MKVKELIELLSKEDPEMEVITWDNNEGDATGPVSDNLFRGAIVSSAATEKQLGKGQGYYWDHIPDINWLTNNPGTYILTEVVVIK